MNTSSIRRSHAERPMSGAERLERLEFANSKLTTATITSVVATALFTCLAAAYGYSLYAPLLIGGAISILAIDLKIAISEGFELVEDSSKQANFDRLRGPDQLFYLTRHTFVLCHLAKIVAAFFHELPQEEEQR